MIPFLGPTDPFPPVEQALDHPDGLLAAGGTLTMKRLVDAYSRGIFPWFNEGDPVLWWSPDPRVVLVPSQVHVSHSLRKRLKRDAFLITIDAAFSRVLDGCAAPRASDSGTWLTTQMQRAYTSLHVAGLAHSIEVWMDGELAGGIYGVAIGRMFFGESMFSRRIGRLENRHGAAGRATGPLAVSDDRLPARDGAPDVARRRARGAPPVRARRRTPGQAARAVLAARRRFAR